ncbi:hypothetical protein BD410DRAFT_64004 [Rickenella mellea]|uniref:Uncharacterized protein n=1 Tax=Rickenella mellea TaxID=50990 RepID=A0A4Y7QC39_9AGAM|nr:hypothetical protein BD410DRAFT_64004 [Rickenella mellea]
MKQCRFRHHSARFMLQLLSPGSLDLHTAICHRTSFPAVLNLRFPTEILRALSFSKIPSAYLLKMKSLLTPPLILLWFMVMPRYCLRIMVSIPATDIFVRLVPFPALSGSLTFVKMYLSRRKFCQ